MFQVVFKAVSSRHEPIVHLLAPGGAGKGRETYSGRCLQST